MRTIFKTIPIILGCVLAAANSFCQPAIDNANNAYVTGNPTLTIAPCTPNCTTTDDLRSLNCDMYELEANGSATDFEEKLSGITWTGGESPISGGGTATDLAYMFLRTTKGLANLYHELPNPSSYLGALNSIAHDADIAVGKYYDAGTPTYFALVVYESDGEIWLESFDLSVTTTGVAITSYHQPLVTVPWPPYVTGGQWLVSNNTGNASKPHVDIIYEVNGGAYSEAYAVKYVVTWEENNAGTPEVWNAEGDLFSPPTQTVYIDDGTDPDIAGITNSNAPSSAADYDDDMVYTTYVENGTNGNLMLAERKWGSSTVNTTVTLQSGSGNDIYYPRIAAPASYDFATTPNNEAVSVVVSAIDFGSGYTAVHSYYYSDPAGLPTVNDESITEFSGSTFFSSNPYNTSMPVVIGAGYLNTDYYISSGGMPFEQYPILFYSELTWDGSSVVSGDGDIFATKTDGFNFAPDNTDLAETNLEDFYTSFDMVNGTKPLLAAATSTNSGFDMLVTYWDGERIYWKDLDAISDLANLKPGRPTGIAQTANQGIKTYPNPVSTQLNIRNAADAVFTVTDMTGRIVNNGTLAGDKATINTAQLVPGIYILHLTKNSHTETVKFTKQ